MIIETVEESGSEWTGEMIAHDFGCARSVFLPSNSLHSICLTERRVGSHLAEHVFQNMLEYVGI